MSLRINCPNIFRWGYPNLNKPLWSSAVVSRRPWSLLAQPPEHVLVQPPELEFGHCGASGGSTPTSFAVATIFNLVFGVLDLSECWYSEGVCSASCSVCEGGWVEFSTQKWWNHFSQMLNNWTFNCRSTLLTLWEVNVSSSLSKPHCPQIKISQYYRGWKRNKIVRNEQNIIRDIVCNPI